MRTQLFVPQTREPDYSSEEGLSEAPELLSGYLIVSGIVANTNVTCLRFDNSTLIPNVTTSAVETILDGHYTHLYNAVSSDTYLNISVDPFLSSGAYYFRCFEVPFANNCILYITHLIFILATTSPPEAETTTPPPEAETTTSPPEAETTTSPPEAESTTSPSDSISINPYSSCPNITSSSVCSWAEDTYCSPNILRVFDSNNCCFTCQVCDSDSIESCPPISLLRTCAFNETSYNHDTPCCQTCIPAIPASTCSFADKSSIYVCPSGVAPSFNDTGCPLCLAADGRSGACTNSKLSICSDSIDDLPHCPVGQQPSRDIDSCCLNCKPVSLNITRMCDPSSPDVVSHCIDNIIPNLHTCQPGETRNFNFSNCCFTCNLKNTTAIVIPSPTISSSDESSSASRCSRSEVSSCVENMPVCGANEVAYNLPSQCCPSCSRPETLCSPNFVVSCLNSSHSCAEDEIPSYVIGECCSTCIPEAMELPECQNECDDDQVCMIMSDTLAECTASSQINILFNSTNSEKQSQLSGYDISTMRMFLNELISRYCTGLSDIAICELFINRGRDFDGTIVSITHLAGGTISVLLTLPNVAYESASTSSSRIRLMDHTDSHLSYLTLLSAASTDDFAANGYQSAVIAVQTTEAPADDDEDHSTSNVSFNLYALIIGCIGAIVTVVILTLCLQRFVFNCNKDGPRFDNTEGDENAGPSHFVEMQTPIKAQYFMKNNSSTTQRTSVSIPPSTRLIREPSEDEVLANYLPKRESLGPSKTYALD